MVEVKTTEYLEYKNHEQWFRDLNENLQRARKIGEQMLLDVSLIQIFYNKIKILKSSYSGYFKIYKEKIQNDLEEVEDSIRDSAFVTSIKHYSKLKNDKLAEFTPLLWDNIDKLLEIFEMICEELKLSELTPQPKTKRQSNPNNAILGGYS